VRVRRKEDSRAKGRGLDRVRVRARDVSGVEDLRKFTKENRGFVRLWPQAEDGCRRLGLG
jgi:hypothetical protein